MLLQFNDNNHDSFFSESFEYTPASIISCHAPKEVQINQRNYRDLVANIGSGGSINRNYHLTNDSYTGSSDIVSIQRRSDSIAQQISDIKRLLIPQIKDIAFVLGVKRQSVYSWLAGENITEENHLRIREIYAHTSIARTRFFGIDKKILIWHLNRSDLVSLLSKPGVSKGEIDAEVLRVSEAATAQMSKSATKAKLALKQSVLRTGAIKDVIGAQDTLDILSGRGYSREIEG